jgi:hypothetical protein
MMSACTASFESVTTVQRAAVAPEELSLLGLFVLVTVDG